MSRLVHEIRVEWRGRDQCFASFASLREAAANAYIEDDFEIDCHSDGFVFQGMKIAALEMIADGLNVVATLSPTPSIILFAAWIMTKLPARAGLTWRDGWPHFFCPPNDDRDVEDAPTPLVPNELVPA